MDAAAPEQKAMVMADVNTANTDTAVPSDAMMETTAEGQEVMVEGASEEEEHALRHAKPRFDYTIGA